VTRTPSATLRRPRPRPSRRVWQACEPMSDAPARESRTLSRRDLASDPITQFRRWLDDAEVAMIPLPNAMAVATADAHGRPSVRHVLLRGVDERGFVFFTNYDSRKGRQLAENPNAGLVFLWKALDRQVNVTGAVRRTSRAESEAYFRSRPVEARIGAWASQQSRVIESRRALEARVAEIEARYPGGDIPLPPFWGGFRVDPETVEFWQGRDHRLHDRFRYARANEGAWRIDRLSP
jgi:pyridoxamine 5'-phosphate oxidase